MIFPNSELTNLGVALLAQVTASAGTLVITKIKIGSGTYAGDIKVLTDLITPFHEFPTSQTQVQPDSSVKIPAYFDNAGFLTSHEWREIGVYAQLGGSPATEILYSYTNGGVNFDYIPSESEAPYRHTLDIRNYISDVASVSFLITELTDKYDFNTHAEMIVATYLVDGDRINLWGKISQNDGIVEKRVVKIANWKDGILLTNGLYANLLEFDFRGETNLNVGGQTENYENMQDVPLLLDIVYNDSNTGIKYKCHTATPALPSPNPDFVTDITNKNLQKQIENLLKGYELLPQGNYTVGSHTLVDITGFKRLFIYFTKATQSSNKKKDSIIVDVDDIEYGLINQYDTGFDGASEGVVFTFDDSTTLKISSITSADDRITRIVAYKF